MRFVLSRQHQALAEVLLRLVDRKPWRIGGDLEQHPARLAVVNRVEIIPIDDRRHVVAEPDQLSAPLQLLRLVRRTPRDVMDSTCSKSSHSPSRLAEQIDRGGRTTAAGLIFIGATLDRYFRAFDISNGRELWKTPLPAGGKATPMTYLGADGRQYVVIAAGGDGKAWGWSDEVIAFALPPAAR